MERVDFICSITNNLYEFNSGINSEYLLNQKLENVKLVMVIEV